MNGLTPPTINRIPIGLLDYFGLKSGGENPHSVDANISPSIDLLDWYTKPLQQVIFWNTAGMNAVGATSGLGAPGYDAFDGTGVVRQDRLFIVTRISAAYTAVGAVTSARFSICGLRRADNSAPALIQQVYQTGETHGTLTGMRGSVVYNGPPIWLRPRESIYGLLENISGGGSLSTNMMMEGWPISVYGFGN